MSYQKWVDEKINWLTAVLAVTKELFQKNYDLIYSIYPYLESGKTEDAQKVVNLISKNLNIAPPLLRYDWSGELDHDAASRGQMSNGQIIVSLTFTKNKYLLAATVVHELMHYVLIHRKNVILPDTLENEKLTDLAAMVLGLEGVMLNGKVIDTFKDKINTLGYLSLEEIAYASQKIHSARNIKGYVNLNNYGLQIINGTISNAQNTQHSYDSDLDLKAIKKMFGSAGKHAKTLLANSKRSFSNVISSSQRKNCPFCRKSIQKDSDICKFCHRVIRERINA